MQFLINFYLKMEFDKFKIKINYLKILIIGKIL